MYWPPTKKVHTVVPYYEDETRRWSFPSQFEYKVDGPAELYRLAEHDHNSGGE